MPRELDSIEVTAPLAVPPQPTRRLSPRSAGRGVELLTVLAVAPQPLGLNDIARTLGITKSAAHRLLKELEALSFVVREADGRYVPDDALIGLSAMLLRRFDLRVAARPVLQKIAATTLETVSLHVQHRQYRIRIDTVQGRHSLRQAAPVGEPVPLYVGPSGKAILAFLPEPVVTPVLEWAAAEGEDLDQLRRQLSAIRRRGYAASVGDRTLGVGGLSVPVFGESGVVAALSVSGPAERWTHQAMEQAAPFVRGECADLSASLGWPIPTE
jgi:DNA-binding IclR family transcriptional regulator